jgi:NTP pyrophosphatase (non-canonical NTP hydrolase)
MEIKELIAEANKHAVEKGFWEDGDEPAIPEKLCLMHSELSEALEELRAGHPVQLVYFNPSKPDKPEGVPIELADCIIRIADLCGQYGIDLDAAIRIKMDYNTTRPYKHNRSF